MLKGQLVFQQGKRTYAKLASLAHLQLCDGFQGKLLPDTNKSTCISDAQERAEGSCQVRPCKRYSWRLNYVRALEVDRWNITSPRPPNNLQVQATSDETIKYLLIKLYLPHHDTS